MNRKVLGVDDDANVHELRPEQVVFSNVPTVDGVLVVKAGTTVSPMVLGWLPSIACLQRTERAFGGDRVMITAGTICRRTA